MAAPITTTAITVVLLLASSSLSFTRSGTSSLVSASTAAGSEYGGANAGGGVTGTGVRMFSGDGAGEGAGEGDGEGILEAARSNLEIRRRKRNVAGHGALSIAFMATADDRAETIEFVAGIMQCVG